MYEKVNEICKVKEIAHKNSILVDKVFIMGVWFNNFGSAARIWCN